MSFGQGNITLVNNPLPPTPPPVENLINGLHLDETNGKLGGDLIEQTYINTADQEYIIGQFNAANLAQYLDAKNMIFDFGIVKVPHLPGRPGNSLIKLDVVNSEYTFGDRDGWNTGETLRMDSNHIQFYNNYGQTFLIDTANQIFQFGDIQNATYLEIANNTFSYLDINSVKYIEVDTVNKLYIFGDVDNNVTINGGAVPSQSFKVGGVEKLNLSLANGITGGDFNFTTGTFNFKSVNGNLFFNNNLFITTIGSFDPLSPLTLGNRTYNNINTTMSGLIAYNIFAPTSGNGVFNNFSVSPIINQTGGANGISRGLLINPTLTSAADFRALEITGGKFVLPVAAAPASATAPGTAGEFRITTGFIYVCVAANTWVRAALATW